MTTIALLVSNKIEPDKSWRRATVDLKHERPRKRRHSRLKGAMERQHGAAAGGDVARAPDAKPTAGPADTALASEPVLEAVHGAAEDTPTANLSAAAAASEETAAATRHAAGPAGGAVLLDDEERTDKAAAKDLPRHKELHSADQTIAQQESAGSASRAGPSSSAQPSGSNSRAGRQAAQRFNPRGLPLAGSLIVAPTSLLKQWEDEIHEKVRVPNQNCVMQCPCTTHTLLSNHAQGQLA